MIETESSGGEEKTFTKIGVLTINISNHLDEIPTVITEFDTFAAEHEIPDRLRRSMKLVFDEMLSNTISYAFPEGGDHSIEVEATLFANRLEVTVVDDGVSFNPLNQPEPDTNLAIEDRDLGGLGIHLVFNVMDEARYRRRENLNEITLVKHIETS